MQKQRLEFEELDGHEPAPNCPFCGERVTLFYGREHFPACETCEVYWKNRSFKD